MGQRGSEGRPGRSKSCKAVGSGGRTRPWLWSPLRQGGPPEEAGGCSRPREPHPIPVWEARRPGAWVRGLSRGASAASPSVPCPQGPRSSWRHRQSPPRLGVEAALLSPGLVPQEQSRPPRPATCPWPLQLPQTQTSGTDDRPVSSHRLALCHLGLRPPGATLTRTLQTLLTPSVWHSAGPPGTMVKRGFCWSAGDLPWEGATNETCRLTQVPPLTATLGPSVTAAEPSGRRPLLTRWWPWP